MSTSNANAEESLLRLPEVLRLIPIGRSTWWAGVKSGRYPPAVKLGPGITAWKSRDITELMNAGV